MQRIVYSFSIRVKNPSRNKEFGQQIGRKLFELPGVRNVTRAYFTFDIEIVRPEEESGRNISLEISDFILASFPQVVELVELDWARIVREDAPNLSVTVPTDEVTPQFRQMVYDMGGQIM